MINSLGNLVRRVMRRVAHSVNKISGGRISANAITVVSLLAHIAIAYLIAVGNFMWAAPLLIVFGLFDTLDGELARLQGKASNAGMVLDASIDRMKEVLLYSGSAYYFINNFEPGFAVWTVLTCGGSLLVSYVKAKGETALGDTKLTANEKNRVFGDGLMRFEVRMAVLVVGLFTNQLAIAIAVIAVLSWFTAFQRLIWVTKELE